MVCPAAKLGLRLTKHAAGVAVVCGEPRSLIVDAVTFVHKKHLLRGTLPNLKVLLTIELIVAHAGGLRRS